MPHTPCQDKRGKGIGGNLGSLVENHPLLVVCLLALVCKETCVRVAYIECSTGSVCLNVEEVQDVVCSITHDASSLHLGDL